MNLLDGLNLKPGDIVSVVGAGGKTTLIEYLSEKLSGRVLVSPSTKMFLPSVKYRLLVNEPIIWSGDHEVVYASEAQSDGKIAGLSPYALNSSFDYLLIEADGSRGMKLKGWKADEPVIIAESKITVGVLDITIVGMEADTSTVFRLDRFKRLTDVADTISIANIADMILHPEGLFKFSKGRKVLVVTNVLTEESKAHLKDLEETLIESGYPLDLIIDGAGLKSYANRVAETGSVLGMEHI